MESVLVVRYGEISLKEKPPYLRRFIIAQDEGGLGGLPPRKIWKTYGRSMWNFLMTLQRSWSV